MKEPFLELKVSILNVKVTSWLFKIKMYFGRLFNRNVWVYYPWVGFSWGKVQDLNFGDDLNVSFLSKLTKDVLLPGCYYCNSPWGTRIGFPWMKGHKRITCIGSVLHTIEYDNTVVWGSGLLTEKHLPTHKLDIKAVRGPLTRKVLLEHGFDCPEVYGDPALLLPYFYKPVKQKKRYKLGIVPHYSDMDKEELEQFRSNPDVLIIPMTRYGTYKSVIDQICSCDVIASSSLHGLIISEAYGIPNVWIEIKEPLFGDEDRRFKFHDFFLSIGCDRGCPIILSNQISLQDLLSQKLYCSRNNISLECLELLIKSCPLNLKNKEFFGI